jgi:hypothetical protein
MRSQIYTKLSNIYYFYSNFYFYFSNFLGAWSLQCFRGVFEKFMYVQM